MAQNIALDGLGVIRSEPLPITISSTIDGQWHFLRLTTRKGWIAKCDCGWTAPTEHYKADAKDWTAIHRAAVQRASGIQIEGAAL